MHSTGICDSRVRAPPKSMRKSRFGCSPNPRVAYPSRVHFRVNTCTLKRIHTFLKPFQRIIKTKEGREFTPEIILPSTKLLLNHYEKALPTYQNNEFIYSALDTNYDKLIKYFNKLKK